MKKCCVLLALVLLSIQIVFAGDDAKQCTLDVKGMTCGACVARVKNAVSRLQGVQTVSISLENGTADVTYLPAKLSPNDLVASIDKTGFVASLSVQQEKKEQKKEIEMGEEMKMPMSPEMDQVRAQLKTAKMKLAQDGHYSCCLKTSCDFCAVSMNMCPCGMNVKEGKPVCGECADGWSVGQGAVSGVDPQKVKREPHAMMKMGYEMRVKMLEGMKEEKK